MSWVCLITFFAHILSKHLRHGTNILLCWKQSYPRSLCTLLIIYPQQTNHIPPNNLSFKPPFCNPINKPLENLSSLSLSLSSSLIHSFIAPFHLVAAILHFVILTTQIPSHLFSTSISPYFFLLFFFLLLYTNFSRFPVLFLSPQQCWTCQSHESSIPSFCTILPLSTNPPARTSRSTSLV